MKGIASNFGMIRHPVHDKILNICHVLLTFLILVLQWNPSLRATQDGGLSKEVACHEG